LFCQNAVCNGKSKPEGPLTFNTPLPAISFEYICSVPTGTGGSVVITPKIIPASIPVKIKSLVTLFQTKSASAPSTHYHYIVLHIPLGILPLHQLHR
jgi:hypothetical protein